MDEFKKYSLINFYNQRSNWLQHLHGAVDPVGWDAYGWPPEKDPADVAEEVILESLLVLNLERAGRHTPLKQETVNV